MTDILAERLLAKIMKWEFENLADERFQIQMFADIKYDNYQKYTQGKRYVESLALWLNNFDEEEREELYSFLKSNLIYISELQMRNLVEMAYQFYIVPTMLNHTKALCSAKNITNIVDRKALYEVLVKKSLFLGLSDGSHIDLFRRANPHLSNEQISVYYDMSKNKVDDMLKGLPKSDIIGDGIGSIYLLDDFSGSGISFIRKEGSKWKGKIAKFFEQLEKYEIAISNINITLLLYIATPESIKYIRCKMNEYKKANSITADYHAEVIQLVESPDYSQKIDSIFKKHYMNYSMNEIEDIHYKKGNISVPYMGFNSCGLPLVIFHNTPNNSLPIIWFDRERYSGLFPRVTRHKEEK